VQKCAKRDRLGQTRSETSTRRHPFLFGAWAGEQVLQSAYPIVPLTGMFMVGSYFGDRYAHSVRSGASAGYVRWLLSLVLPLTALSAVMVAFWATVKADVLGSSQFLRDVFYPDRAFTLYGLYLAGFLLLFAFWIWRSELRERDTTPIDHALLILGKTSLFTYVAQYVIFQTLPYGLGLQGAMPLWGIAALPWAFRSCTPRQRSGIPW
jgi:uncharacterized membrane protein YeiB